MRCAVAYCENEGRHKFPKDEVRRKQWIEAIKHLKKINITSSSVICSDHFQLSDFSVIPTYWNNYYTGRIVSKTVVPSVFPWGKPAEVVQIPQPPPPIQETLSFNPKQVKATYSRVLPTVRVEEKNNIVSTVTDNSLKTNKKLRCLITDCENEGRHKFPKDEVRRRQWIEAIKCLKPRTNLTISPYSLLCSHHFRLSVFPWDKTSVEVTQEQPLSPIQVKLEQPSSSIQVEPSSSSILFKQLSLPINVKLERPSPSGQVKKLSSPKQVKILSSSIRAKKLPSSIRVKQHSSSVQVKEPSSSIQVKQLSSSVQVKLEPPLSPIQVQLEPPLSPIQVKLEPPSSPIKVKKTSSSIRVKQPPSSIQVKKSSSSIRVKKSSSIRVKKLSSAIRVKQPSSAIQVKLEPPLSPIQVEQSSSSIPVKQPSVSIQVKLEPPSSPIPVKLEPPSSPIQVKQLSPIKVKKSSSSIKVRQLSSPIQDTLGFNRSGKVKATDPRVMPTVFVGEQNDVVSTVTEDPHEDPLLLSCYSISD